MHKPDNRRERALSTRRLPLLLSMWALCAAALADDARPELNGAAARPPEEHAIRRIPLAGAVSRRRAEISDLAWYGGDLLLLPQFAKDRLYKIPKADILAYLDGASSAPLTAGEITFVLGDLQKIPGDFDGFEAIAIHGNEVFLLIEGRLEGRMGAHLVRGAINEAATEINLDPESYTPVPLQSQVYNMSAEALIVLNGELAVLHEANGVNVVANPYAHVFSLKLEPKARIAFPTIEYRVTGATEAGANGRFWITNYFYQGDAFKLRPERDILKMRHGVGRTHREAEIVERLVQLEFRDGAIALTGAPPIQLEIDPYEGRNWEGIVRLDTRGFLIMTDSYPETILAFVEYPQGGAATVLPQKLDLPGPVSSSPR